MFESEDLQAKSSFPSIPITNISKVDKADEQEKIIFMFNITNNKLHMHST